MKVVEKDGWVLSQETGSLSIAADRQGTAESVELDPSGLKVQVDGKEVYVPMWLLATMMHRYTNS